MNILIRNQTFINHFFCMSINAFTILNLSTYFNRMKFSFSSTTIYSIVAYDMHNVREVRACPPIMANDRPIRSSIRFECVAESTNARMPFACPLDSIFWTLAHWCNSQTIASCIRKSYRTYSSRAVYYYIRVSITKLWYHWSNMTEHYVEFFGILFFEPYIDS